MKRRYRVLLNLFSAALLLFAMYLNFVKKEPGDVFVPDSKQNTTSLVPASKNEVQQTQSYKPSDGTLVLK